MPAPVTIASAADFQNNQATILRAINGAQRGAELFLVDPFRFLGENGFLVSPAAQAELEHRAPALTKLPTGQYDLIKAGQAAPMGVAATVPVTWHIHSLGVTL